ncbi:MAG: SCO family protein [Gammaproteobacteria bacterium]
MSGVLRFLPVILVAAGAAAAGAWFAARVSAPEAPEHARILERPRAVPAVPMTGADGEALDPSLFRDHWTLVFFGFTNCPDVCPMTLQTLAGASERLGDLPEARQPEVVMISLDPRRDEPEQLGRYVAFFDESFRGISVAAEDLPELTRAFGAAFAYVPAGEDSYTVDHTASVFLVDPQARLAAVFTTPHTAEGIARDYRRVLAAREAG